jgi:hypothetical protein
MMEMDSRPNHGQMGEAGQDHALTMILDSANDGFLHCTGMVPMMAGLRNQLADEGLCGYSPDAVWRTRQSSFEHRDEGVHLCLSCKRHLDDDEGQQSQKAFSWRGTDRYVPDTN